MVEIPERLCDLKDKISYLRSKKPIIHCPKRPYLPHHRITKDSTVEAVRAYAKTLLKYAEDRESFDRDYEIYTRACQAAEPQCQAIEDQIIFLINEDVGLTKLGLSERKIAKLWDKAWSDAYNEDEAISNLRELVELFRD
ncbi:endonuclease [Pseudanabaena phage PA-SR01]|nr:endonuclease [Pseudanabaena phage PA-SR01]